MMYMFDHDEILSCMDCDLCQDAQQGPICVLDEIDVECTDVGDGIPAGCPLTSVTIEKAVAYGVPKS